MSQSASNALVSASAESTRLKSGSYPPSRRCSRSSSASFSESSTISTRRGLIYLCEPLTGDPGLELFFDFQPGFDGVRFLGCFVFPHADPEDRSAAAGACPRHISWISLLDELLHQHLGR